MAQKLFQALLNCPALLPAQITEGEPGRPHVEALQLQHLFVGHDGHNAPHQPAQLQKHPLYPTGLLQLTGIVAIPELLALLWSDLDVQNRSISVTKSVARLDGELVVSKPKTQHSIRTLIVPQQAVDLLIQEHSLHPNNPYLFPSPTTGTMYSPETVARIHKRILRDAGLEDCRFHDLRHTFATVALQNGVDIKTLSGMLGHYSSGFTLDTYTHVTRKMQEEAAEKMGQFMEMKL